MSRSDFLYNAENKKICEYLLGRYVQDYGYDVQYANADVDVENVKCAMNKLAIGYVLVTADETGNLLLFVMHFHLSDRKNKTELRFEKKNTSVPN